MTTTATSARARLERPRAVVLSGVSIAVARHLGLSVAGVRIGFLALTLLAGAGALLYLWLWALTPLERPRADLAGVTRAVPVAIIFLTLSVLAAVLAVTFHLTGFFTGPLIPGMVESAIFAALCVWWTLGVDRADPLWRPAGPAIRLSAAVVLVVEGALLLLQQWRPAVAVVAVFLIIMGVGILIIPRVVTLWTELGGERAARVREEQRAEIAAHLHDSVLQTLALIQNRAGPQSEVARIARAQERELRDWLFAGTDPFARDLAAELRSFAAELELEYAVRIEVITAGEVAGIASASLSGAAREAMLNAARHAGGEVTVFLEATPGAIDVFVRDHGSGFDPAEVPDGRLGVR